jgi:hypothetical protein
MKADTNLHFLGPSPTDFGNKDGYFYFFQSPCQLGLKPQLSFQNYSHNNCVVWIKATSAFNGPIFFFIPPL